MTEVSQETRIRMRFTCHASPSSPYRRCRRRARGRTERGEDGIEAGYGALGSRSSHLRYPPRFPATPRAVHTPHSLAVRLSCVPSLA